MALRPIVEIAEKLGIEEKYLENYGRYTAKVRLELLTASGSERTGKLILVTAITPTGSGEGKTVTSIGLGQGLTGIGKKAVISSREPSLGPVFGMKGGATGGGKSQVLPAEKINLHFNGDFHAITSAHNLLAAMIDAHIHNGNQLQIDVNNITWPRTMDMNDRALRNMVTGLGGKLNGPPRESGFIITAASEIMAILALSKNREDLRDRMSRIVIGFDLVGKAVLAQDLRAIGAMMVLLNEAIMPNLVQTTEGTPAFVHCGPFANIAHGTSSVLALSMGLQQADYVVNETGFGADLGAEKFFDVVMPSSGIRPRAAVVIATVKGLMLQGSSSASTPDERSATRLRTGFANLAKHIENLRKFGVSPVVAINRFPDDTKEELEMISGFCRELGVPSAFAEGFERGGEGMMDLAEKAVSAADSSDPAKIRSLYSEDLSLEKKIETVAREIYGAASVHIEPTAAKKLKKFTEMGLGKLPVCMAKTQYSLSDNPKLLGAPKGFTVTVRDANVSAGAGFVVAVLGDMMLMPGLGKTPQAFHMDVNDSGNITGM